MRAALENYHTSRLWLQEQSECLRGKDCAHRESVHVNKHKQVFAAQKEEHGAAERRDHQRTVEYKWHLCLTALIISNGLRGQADKYADKHKQGRTRSEVVN